MNLESYGYRIGTLPRGPRNAITDIPGVTVGHSTLHEGDIHSGVTVIMPAQDDLFQNKLTAACHIHNGFGKTCGLMQIQELGTIETPIALTGTLNVGLVHDAMVEYMLSQCQELGYSIRSVNPIVGECNDGKLSNIALRPVRKEHVFSAISTASEDFLQGSVGAGSGTICYGLKGGIGSASRVIQIGETAYSIGVLVQSNFGATEDLMIAGNPIGKAIAEKVKEPASLDAGSIMTILATDLPVSSRQLWRILRRCGVGLARTGSYLGHGSGEVMIGFTTANRVPHEGQAEILHTILQESLLEDAFRAASEATEEAVINSMLHADGLTGYQGYSVSGLRDFL